MATTKKIRLYKKELQCIFCGLVTGGITIPESKKSLSQEELGFIDIRCDTHLSLYGDFKKMTEEFEEKTGQSSQAAEDFVKQYRKREDFEKELVKEIEKEEIIV